MKNQESIIDEILFAERLFKEEQRNEKPYLLVMTPEAYDKLCAELDVESIEVYHGMDIEIDDDIDDFELFVNTELSNELDYDESEGYFD